MPYAEPVIRFWSEKGFWVFFPRYRGTWESGGTLLKSSPELDIRDVMDGIELGFTALGSHLYHRLYGPEFYLFGGSFGSPAAILCSKEERVKKAVTFSTVVDWRALPQNAVNITLHYTGQAFGAAYRFDHKDFTRLKNGEFYNPAHHASELMGSKLLFIHARDDKETPFAPVKAFAKKVGAKLITLPTGGHFGYSRSMEPKLYKKIRAFLKAP